MTHKRELCELARFVVHNLNSLSCDRISCTNLHADTLSEKVVILFTFRYPESEEDHVRAAVCGVYIFK